MTTAAGSADRVGVGCTFRTLTAPAPGAIGMIQVHGDVAPLLEALTGTRTWEPGRLRLVPFEDIDEGLAGLVTETTAHLMPHGGVRVMQRLAARLRELGAAPEPDDDPRRTYPEARDAYEALALAAVARARSPLAVDLLLDQPQRWRANPVLDAEDRARSTRLNRLIDPPMVVLAGPPNVGKSTLSNALFGRALSITLDRPGTTRDYTHGWLDVGGLVVQWHDTPGLRETDDPIEREAVAVARALLPRADMLVAITDAGHDWPRLPREPDLRVAARSDLGARDDADVSVCTPAAIGIAELVRRIRDRLVPRADMEHPGPWGFDERLLDDDA